jgi:hypothetical protein
VRSAPARFVFAALLLVGLVLAGVVSFYASGSPDGLERVAEDTGFLNTASEHATADGPLADYRAQGIEDDRLAGGLAGVAGALVVLGVAGGLTFALRRRMPEHADRS